MAMSKLEENSINALKALDKGVASAGQQQMAIRYLLKLTGIRNPPSVTENERQDAFNEGMRFVGWQIARLIETTGLTTDPSTNKKDS
jgi:single-stranded DNA-specific DHH superfamily exonuclease